jgi:hypothetical protein
MTKLSEFKKDYQELSGKASDVARQLSFAGIAIIWIFRVNKDSGVTLNSELILPTILLCCSLACDLLQYIWGSIVWGSFHRYHEKRTDSKYDPELTAPPILNWPSLAFFYLKLIGVILSYIFIIKYCWDIYI